MSRKNQKKKELLPTIMGVKKEGLSYKEIEEELGLG